jgi:hypothetical protein
MRRTIGIFHAVGIAMVGDDERSVSCAQGGLYEDFRTGIHCFAGFDSGFPDAGMAHHVGISEVEANEVRRPSLKVGKDGIPHLVGTHFGFEVIGRYFGGGNKDSFLAGKGVFPAAIEEVGNVGVLLGFSNTDLFEARFGDHGAQGLLNVHFTKEVVYSPLGEDRVIFGKRNEEEGQGTEVVGHGDEGATAVGVGEVARKEGLDELPRAVIAKVEEKHRIAGLDRSGGANNGWLEELISKAALILGLYGGLGCGIRGAFAVNEEPVSYAGAFPAPIAIHGVVAPYDRSQSGLRQGLQSGLGFFEVGKGRLGCSITTVCKCMQIDGIGEVL